MCFHVWTSLVTIALGWALLVIGYISVIRILPRRISKEAEEKVKDRTFPEVTLLHQRYMYRAAFTLIVAGVILIILGSLHLMAFIKI